MSNPFNVAKEGSVASRFVSSTELSEAQKKREQSLKEAYARIGQSPPPSSSGSGAAVGGEGAKEEYDPRSLFERLQAQKNSKQEKFDETWKLSNQFRGIDEGESDFLAEVERERREAEKRKRDEERRELEAFRMAALSKETSPPAPSSLLPTALSNSPPPAASPPAPASSNAKAASPVAATATSKSSASSSSTASSATKAKRKRDGGGLLGIKRKTDVKKSKSGEGEKKVEKAK